MVPQHGDATAVAGVALCTLEALWLSMLSPKQRRVFFSARSKRYASSCCRLNSDECFSLPAPLGPEGQGGFRFPPFDPLDSHNPLNTTRGKPLDPRGMKEP